MDISWIDSVRVCRATCCHCVCRIVRIGIENKLLFIFTDRDNRLNSGPGNFSFENYNLGGPQSAITNCAVVCVVQQHHAQLQTMCNTTVCIMLQYVGMHENAVTLPCSSLSSSMPLTHPAGIKNNTSRSMQSVTTLPHCAAMYVTPHQHCWQSCNVGVPFSSRHRRQLRRWATTSL